MAIESLIQTLAVFALPVVLAITLHEAAHGYAALRLGDATAYMLGRVTLNPVAHIDWIGTVAMPIALFLVSGGAFLFGYAKPVPVRFDQLRHPKRDMIWVALAGPAANLAQAAVWIVLAYALATSGLDEAFLVRMAGAGVLVNLALFAFNMLPLLPLDGGRVLVGLLPHRAAMQLAQTERWGLMLVLLLVLVGVIGPYWMLPLMHHTASALEWLLQPLRWFLF
jgi:Zn-dependent protease